MPATMCSRATLEQESLSTSMNGRVVEMEELVKKLTSDVEALWQENETLSRKNAEFKERAGPNKRKRILKQPMGRDSRTRSVSE